jgi:hypothetical protein
LIAAFNELANLTKDGQYDYEFVPISNLEIINSDLYALRFYRGHENHVLYVESFKDRGDAEFDIRRHILDIPEDDFLDAHTMPPAWATSYVTPKTTELVQRSTPADSFTFYDRGYLTSAWFRQGQ